MIRLKRFYRSVMIVFLFAFFGVGALFERYIVFPFQKSKKQNYDTLYKSWKFFVNLLEKTGMINLKVENVEKIEKIKNSIIVSTHPSFIDIVILMSLIPNTTCFVAQRLADNLFLKGMVKRLFIIEGKSTDIWINEACEKLDSGLNIVIFPMGIRHRKNECPKIRRGTALLAQKSKKNIVAINMETSFDFLQINQPIYDAGEKAVEYNVQYIDEINTDDCLQLYDDEVSFRTEITRKISHLLYRK